MAIKLGSSDISKVYLGATEVSKIYLGATEVYSSAADYGTYVNAMITRANALSYTLPPAATLTDLQNRLATIGATTLNKLDVLHIYSPDAGTMDFFTLNVVAPATIQATLINAPSSSKLGIVTDGSTDYIDSGFDPYNDATNFTLNDNHIGAITSQSTQSTGGAGVNAGVIDTAATESILAVRILRANNGDYSSNNSEGSNQGSTGINRDKLYIVIQRVVSTQFDSYKDGSLVNTKTEVSTRIPNVGNVFLGGFNEDGSITSRSINRFVGFTAGASITTTEMATINTQITAFYGR